MYGALNPSGGEAAKEGGGQVNPILQKCLRESTSGGLFGGGSC